MTLQLEDGYVENMGDTLVIMQKDSSGSQHGVVITRGDLEALMDWNGPERVAQESQ